jgi:hypothetical protein
MAVGLDAKRQTFRRGFKTEALAVREEQLADDQFGRTDLADDGTVAAELVRWLPERELDLAFVQVVQLPQCCHEVHRPDPRTVPSVHIGQACNPRFYVVTSSGAAAAMAHRCRRRWSVMCTGL